MPRGAKLPHARAASHHCLSQQIWRKAAHTPVLLSPWYGAKAAKLLLRTLE